MILHVTRSSIKMKIDEKTITICGEGLIPTPGKPDFVVTVYDVDAWDPPFESELIDMKKKREILNTLVDEMLNERGIVVEIEE